MKIFIGVKFVANVNVSLKTARFLKYLENTKSMVIPSVNPRGHR